MDDVCQWECELNCDPADQACGTCCLGQEGLSRDLGGACGMTARCHPDVLGDRGFQACLADQCESQLCTGGFCSQRCRQDADCSDAENGPVGDVFTCRVAAGQESGICIPGSQQLCATSRLPQPVAKTMRGSSLPSTGYVPPTSRRHARPCGSSSKERLTIARVRRCYRNFVRELGGRSTI